MNRLLGAVAICLIVGGILTSWKSMIQTHAENPVSASQGQANVAPIPKEAIRLRIIANSDTDSDQNLKREVRDRVITTVGVYLRNAKTINQARTAIRAHVPQLDAVARRVVAAKGFHYSVSTMYGVVPFPTKEYGDRVYPAGNYEALRIVLGKGLGQNWWCVLFPPLCFVDLANGAAVPNKVEFPDSTALATIELPVAGGDGATQKTQVRSAVLDYGGLLLKKIVISAENLLDHLF